MLHSVFWFGVEEIENKPIFGDAIPVAGVGLVRRLDPGQDSLRGVTPDERSIESCSATVFLFKSSREYLIKFRGVSPSAGNQASLPLR